MDEGKRVQRSYFWQDPYRTTTSTKTGTNSHHESRITPNAIPNSNHRKFPAENDIIEITQQTQTKCCVSNPKHQHQNQQATFQAEQAPIEPLTYASIEQQTTA